MANKKVVINKKAQNISLTTILLMVLGVVVLVLLIWGFSSGWSNMWDKIVTYIGGGSNIDAVRQACALACSAQNVYDYCELERTIKYGKKVNAWDGEKMSEVRKSIATCEEMAKHPDRYPGVNVEPCSSITCPAESSEKSK